MALFSNKKEPMSASDLSHITRGLHQAAAATHNLVAQQYIKLFDQFFDYNPDDLGTPMKAKMVEVGLDEQHTMNIPLIALVAPRGLSVVALGDDLTLALAHDDALSCFQLSSQSSRRWSRGAWQAASLAIAADATLVGASDGASSGAFLIELARVLKDQPREFTYEFVWFDGEEAVHEPSAAGRAHRRAAGVDGGVSFRS